MRQQVTYLRILMTVFVHACLAALSERLVGIGSSSSSGGAGSSSGARPPVRELYVCAQPPVAG